MENLSIWEVFLVVAGAMIGLATIINTIGSAVEKVSKARKAMKAPNDEQDRRISDLEKDMENVKLFLDSDKKRLTALEKGTGVWMRGMLALLGHGL